MKELLQIELVRLLLVLPVAIAANIFIGYGNAKAQNKKDYDKFKLGLVKGAYIYLGIGLWALISYYMPSIGIELNGTEYTLLVAMEMIIWASILYYAQSSISNLAKLFKYKQDEKGDVEDEVL
mgnify:CR=1 FL=1